MSIRYFSRVYQPLKAFYLGIGKSFVILSSAFLAATGISIIELGIIFYIKEIYAATPGQIGFFTALWSLCYLAGCIFIRPLFNKFLPRYLLMGSSFLMCFFVFSLLFTQSFPTAHIYYGLYGMAMSFFWPPIMGWLSQDIEGARLGKSVSYFNLSWSAGIIVGPLVAGVMSAISPRLPLYTGASLFFVTGTLIVAASFTLPKIRADKKVDLSNDQENTRQDSSTFLRFPGWVGMFTSFVVIGVIINIFPVYARDELFQPKEIIGLLMQSRTFIATFVFIYLGHTTFWHFRISYMISSQIFLACLLLLMRFSSSALILGVLISLVGAVRAHSYTNSVFHGVSGSIKRTGRMAVHESLLAAGLICGSAIGGSLFQYYSMATVYYFCSAVVLFGALVQLALFFILNRVEDHHS